MTGSARTPFQAAQEQLRQRGINLRMVPGAYVVNFRNGKPATEYVTDNLSDAVTHACSMGLCPAPEAPLGPTGTYRGRMLAEAATNASKPSASLALENAFVS